jgi:hypothetical protein
MSFPIVCNSCSSFQHGFDSFGWKASDLSLYPCISSNAKVCSLNAQSNVRVRFSDRIAEKVLSRVGCHVKPEEEEEEGATARKQQTVTQTKNHTPNPATAVPITSTHDQATSLTKHPHLQQHGRTNRRPRAQEAPQRTLAIGSECRPGHEAGKECRRD